MKIIRSDAENIDFISLVKLLDQDLAIRDGKDHAFYHQFNNIDVLKHTIILYENNEAVGCGAFKKFDDTSVEVKRMYTLPKYRGKGIATKILFELENWAKEIENEFIVLETGKKQPEAIAMYKKNGYKIISNFDPYKGIDNSVCFRKKL